MDLFEEVIDMEKNYLEKKNIPLNKYEFTFKSLNFIVKILCKLKKPDKLNNYLDKCLLFMQHVSRQEATEAINNIIEEIMDLESD